MGRRRIDPGGGICKTITASVPGELHDRLKRIADKYFDGNVSAMMREVITAGLESLRK